MVRRKRIGINFSFNNQNNSGIVNYLVSVIRGLNYLDDQQKPFLIIFYKSDTPIELIKEINYPFISFRHNASFLPKSISGRGLNFFSRKVLKRNIYKIQPKYKDVQYIFPVFPDDNCFKSIPNKIHWLVDFNAYYFSHHYSDNGAWFKRWHSSVVEKNDTVVLSSFDSFEDFKKFYPLAKNKVKILRFASMLPDFEKLDAEEVIKKHGVERPYFITPNQFWEHKNHITLLKAFKILHDKGFKYQLILTGSTTVNRGKGFVLPGLNDFVLQNKLSDVVKFLGAIDRKEQLVLLQNSKAIVQPSLYEGWSTIVEESKAMNKFIVLSDLNVNKEQINKNCVFFDPLSPQDLANKLEQFMNDSYKLESLDYSVNIKEFAQDILDVFN